MTVREQFRKLRAREWAAGPVEAIERWRVVDAAIAHVNPKRWRHLVAPFVSRLMTEGEIEAFESARPLSELQAAAGELRCYVTVKRCGEFGCAHCSVLTADGYRCAACVVYGLIEKLSR
jgi:hypothetical protein